MLLYVYTIGTDESAHVLFLEIDDNEVDKESEHKESKRMEYAFILEYRVNIFLTWNYYSTNIEWLK